MDQSGLSLKSYANYIARQEKDILAMERDEQQIIPADLEYGLIEGLSNEMVAKMLILSRLRKTGVKKTGS